MNIKNIFIPILLIFFCACISCKKDIRRESEPNNNYFSANIIEPDMAIEGLLDRPSDHDFYRLDIVSPVCMDIELTSVKGVNHAIAVWKETAGGQEIQKYIDDARKSSPERVCNMYFDPGTYFIEILFGDRDAPNGNSENYYQLRLASRDFGDEEKESNDSYEHADFIEAGQEIKGYFSPSFNKLNNSLTLPLREEDWFYVNIDLIDNNPVLFDASITGVPDVKPALYLFDEERSELASSASAGAGEETRLEGIGILKPGKYYIMVTSNFETNNNIPYSLQVNTRNYDYSTELEPNNNFAAANLLEKNEISAKIFPEGDRDFFLYRLHDQESSGTDEQYLYRIEASSQNLNLILKVYDENRKKLFDIDNLKFPGKEVFPNALLKKNFYIELFSKGLAGPALDYTLSISGIPFTKEHEIEPNDTKETATRIQSEKIIGFISKKGDKDYYLLEYKQRVRKKLYLYGIKNSKLKILVTDSLGYIVRTESVTDANSVSFNEMIDSRGYLIIESIEENYDEPYIVEIGD